MLCLHDIPAPQGKEGIVSITIRNYGGSLHGEEVTDNFVLSRTMKIEAGGRGDKLTWKLRAEYSTSKLPSVRKQIPQMDTQTVHSVAFTLSSSTGRPGITMMWKKFLLVLGRGTSSEHDIMKSCDLSWDELEQVDNRYGAVLPASLLMTATPFGETSPSISSAPMSSRSKKRNRPEEVEDGEEEEEGVESSSLDASESSLGEKGGDALSLPEKFGKRRKVQEEGELSVADETEDEEDEHGESKRAKKSIKQSMEEFLKAEMEDDADDRDKKRDDKEEDEEGEGEGGSARDTVSNLTSSRVSAADGTAPPRPAPTFMVSTRNDSDMMEGDDGKNEPLEAFSLEPRSVPSLSRAMSGGTAAMAQVSGAMANVGATPQLQQQPPQPSTTAAGGGTAAAPGAPPSATAVRQDALHLSIRLMDVQTKQPVPWGSMVPDETHLAIAMHNPSDDKIRVVCHVCDKDEKRLTVDGKMVLDLSPKESSVMCKFHARGKDGPVQLHFLAAALPLLPGRPLYHTRLFINVEVTCNSLPIVF